MLRGHRYNITNDVTIYSGCDWGEVGGGVCTGSTGQVCLDCVLPPSHTHATHAPILTRPPSRDRVRTRLQVATVSPCGLIPGFSPWATNVPIAIGNGCVSAGCSASQCVKVTQSCATGRSETQCVDGAASSTANPGVIVAEAAVMALGVLLVVARNALIGWRRLIAIVMIVWGVRNIGADMVVTNGCDWCTCVCMRA